MNTTTTTEERESRPYPYICRSSFCARTECSGCPHLPALEDFNAWCDEHAAVLRDETWAPLYYTATR